LLPLWLVPSLAGVCCGILEIWSPGKNLLIFQWSLCLLQSGLQTQTCDDEASTASSGFGSDEKTIKAVFEQIKVRYNKACNACMD